MILFSSLNSRRAVTENDTGALPMASERTIHGCIANG